MKLMFKEISMVKSFSRKQTVLEKNGIFVNVQFVKPLF